MFPVRVEHRFECPCLPGIAESYCLPELEQIVPAKDGQFPASNRAPTVPRLCVQIQFGLDAESAQHGSNALQERSVCVGDEYGSHVDISGSMMPLSAPRPIEGRPSLAVDETPDVALLLMRGPSQHFIPACVHDAILVLSEWERVLAPSYGRQLRAILRQGIIKRCQMRIPDRGQDAYHDSAEDGCKTPPPRTTLSLPTDWR